MNSCIKSHIFSRKNFSRKHNTGPAPPFFGFFKEKPFFEGGQETGEYNALIYGAHNIIIMCVREHKSNIKSRITFMINIPWKHEFLNGLQKLPLTKILLALRTRPTAR